MPDEKGRRARRCDEDDDDDDDAYLCLTGVRALVSSDNEDYTPEKSRVMDSFHLAALPIV